MSSDENPFASPMADVDDPRLMSVAETDAELVRRNYVKHEASVQSVGYLYYFAAMLFGLGTISLSLMVAINPGWSTLGLLALYAVLTGAFFWIGKALRRLDPRVKLPVGLLSGIGLIFVPLGTIINGYILYLVFSEKGKIVFSPAYREIIEQTPHIKYKTSMLVSILVAVLVAIFVVVLIAFLVPR